MILLCRGFSKKRKKKGGGCHTHLVHRRPGAPGAEAAQRWLDQQVAALVADQHRVLAPTLAEQPRARRRHLVEDGGGLGGRRAEEVWGEACIGWTPVNWLQHRIASTHTHPVSIQ